MMFSFCLGQMQAGTGVYLRSWLGGLFIFSPNKNAAEG